MASAQPDAELAPSLSSARDQVRGRDTVIGTHKRPGERVERDLRERIASGEWQADEVLPTVADLADHYEVSPGVIQRVLKRLQADGLVRVIPRWGTFWA